MTGLTTTAALHKLHSSITGVLDTAPRYLLSPYITWYSAAGMIIYLVWIVVCSAFVNVYIAMLTFLLALLTTLLLALDTFLSYREKSSSVRDILEILQGYNAAHKLGNSETKRSSGKPGFYLNETYPSSTSVSVQRVYRNGKVVTVGSTLLVEGDVIVLSPGEEAPTHCRSLDDNVELKGGDIYPDKRDDTSGGKHCTIVTARLPLLFTVLKTEYQCVIERFLQLTKRYSKLTLEIGYVLRVLHSRLIPAVMVLSVGIAVLQYKFLSSDSQIEAVLTTIIPLLPTIYPIYYTIAHNIGTALIIHTCRNTTASDNSDLMKTPDNTSRLDLHDEGGFSMKRILYQTYSLLSGKAYRYLPRNSNIFDTLAAVTVLCTVNKEGILSRPNPNVERIMLLDPAIPETNKDTSQGLNVVAEEPTPELSSTSKDESRTRIISTTSDTDYEAESLVRALVGSLPNLHHTTSEDDIKIGQVRSLQSSMIVDSKFSIDAKYSSDVEYRKLSEVPQSGTSDTELQTNQDSEVQTRKSSAEKKSKIWRLSNTKKRLSGRTSRDSKGSGSATPQEGGVGPQEGGAGPQEGGIGQQESDIEEMSPMIQGEGSKVKKKRKPFWQMMKMSRYRELPCDDYDTEQENPAMQSEDDGDSQHSHSLKDDFVVVLNISLSKQSPLGLSFDYTDLEQLKDCLKPVGLAVLLNNMCSDSGNVSTHLKSISVQNYCGLTFKLPLPTDYCNCVIGREIGFTRNMLSQYNKLCNLITYVPRRGDAVPRTQRNPADDMSPLTCIVSSVVRDKGTTKRHLMSYGTAPFIMKCCYHYWNGQDVRPLQTEHRARVLEFYNQNRLTSHCFVLAYRPLLDSEPTPHHDVFLSLPKGLGFLDEKSTYPHDPAENLLKLQSGQTFLGVMCAQFQPKHDVVAIVEALVAANIRFVHFSYDNELRSRAFGTKLGLETGWNCHISLAEGDYDNFSVDSNPDGEDLEPFHYYTCKARLPQGIKNIRPHLENVDNVPLLVPLFTSCTPAAIEEMISIMQENRELVCCVGSSLQLNNFSIFLQADCSIGMIPHLPQQCLISGIKEMTLPWLSGDYLNPPKQGDFVGVNCLHLASILNTVPCSLVVSRDRMVIEPMIRAARSMSVALKQSGHLAISMYCVLSFYNLLHQMLLLPPPLSVSWCLYLSLFVIPLLAATPFTLKTDSKIMQLHTGKREAMILDFGRHLKYFAVRWLTLLLVAPLNTILTLDQMCDNCTMILGSRDNTTARFSPQSIALVQHYNLLIVAFVFCIFSFSLAHRTKPLNITYLLNSFTRWTAIIPLVCATTTLLVAIISLLLSSLMLSYTPVLAISLLLVLPLLQLALSELTKMYDRRLFTRYQRRQKLQFGTKLGMNSPF